MTEAEKTEVLVVATKVKNYIKEKSGFNTSAAVFPKLTARIQQLCDQAMERAKSEGRKTVMERDFE
jgi:histone H3/H4